MITQGPNEVLNLNPKILMNPKQHACTEKKNIVILHLHVSLMDIFCNWWSAHLIGQLLITIHLLLVILAGLVLRAGGQGFPPATFIGK